MKRRWTYACLAISLLLFSACAPEQDEGETLLIRSEIYDFSESDHGWRHGFAEYPASADSVLFEMKYAYTNEPSESLLTKRSVMLSGKNVNRDLFMYLKKKVTGLKPDTDYTLTFQIELATTCSAPEAANTGSVYLKAGASSTEPLSIVRDGIVALNLDKGNEATSGKDVVSLGDLVSTSKNATYVLVSKNNAIANAPYVVRSNSDGELWLIIGTDSSLEGTTTIFYTRLNIVFSAS